MHLIPIYKNAGAINYQLIKAYELYNETLGVNNWINICRSSTTEARYLDDRWKI